MGEAAGQRCSPRFCFLVDSEYPSKGQGCGSVVERLPSMHKALGWILCTGEELFFFKLGVVGHANPGTQESEARWSGMPGRPQLESQFQASLSYMRPARQKDWVLLITEPLDSRITSILWLSDLCLQGGVKVLITGPWTEAAERYSCVFDHIAVPASLVQPGVLRCYCPGMEIVDQGEGT